MNVPNELQPDAAASVLADFRDRGVRLWVENDQLHYKAPKGALSSEQMETLRAAKRDIMALLGAADSGVHSAETTMIGRAPMTFSQLAHWRAYRLSTRRAIRQIAIGVCLKGRLHVEALQACLSSMVRRHEALRTRIVLRDGVPVQEVHSFADCSFAVETLETFDRAQREVEVQQRIAQLIMDPIDVAVGPLFGVKLLRLQEEEHVLALAMEHMISDAFSTGILLRDLLIAYAQTVRGKTVQLPLVPIQFSEYATEKCATHSAWLSEHGTYWVERLKGAQRVRFPESEQSRCVADVGCGTVRVRICRELLTPLREWCRLRRTTLVMGILTAYVAVVLRWCRMPEGSFRYQTDGRTSAKFADTVGYFAAELHLRLQLLEEDRFTDLLDRVVAEYRAACEHADGCYISAQVPALDVARTTLFNWIPQPFSAEIEELRELPDMLTCTTVPFVHPMLADLDFDNEPSVLLTDSGGEIVGDVHYPLNRFARDDMERFNNNFLRFLTTMLCDPDLRVSDLTLE